MACSSSLQILAGVCRRRAPDSARRGSHTLATRRWCSRTSLSATRTSRDRSAGRSRATFDCPSGRSRYGSRIAVWSARSWRIEPRRWRKRNRKHRRRRCPRAAVIDQPEVTSTISTTTPCTSITISSTRAVVLLCCYVNRKWRHIVEFFYSRQTSAIVQNVDGENKTKISDEAVAPRSSSKRFSDVITTGNVGILPTEVRLDHLTWRHPTVIRMR